jgi:hypothetical protein
MSEVNLKSSSSPADASVAGLTSATKNLQAFAAEIADMSRQSIEHTTETIEKLRQARGVSEILAIQTNYVREAFEHLSQHARKFSEMMASFPLEMSKTYTEAWTKSLKTAADAAQQAGEKAAENVERFSKP